MKKKIEIKSKYLQEYIWFYNSSSHRNIETSLLSTLVDVKNKLVNYHTKSNSVGIFRDLYKFFEQHFSSNFYSRFNSEFFKNCNEENINEKILKIENFIKHIKEIENFTWEIVINSKLESNLLSKGFIEILLNNKNYSRIIIKKDFILNADFNIWDNIKNIEVKWTFKIINLKRDFSIYNSFFYHWSIENINDWRKLIFNNCNFLKENKTDNLFRFANNKIQEFSILWWNIEWIIKFEKNTCNKIKIVNVNTKWKKRWNILLERLKNTSEITIWWINKNSKLDTLELSKVFNTEGSWLILIYNIQVKNFIYHWSTSIPKLSISWVKFENLEFSEIDLWKSMFNNLELDNIHLNWANLNECILNAINFKWNYRLSEKRLLRVLEKKNIKITEVSESKLKDNYRQLKFVMDKNWNHTEANKFFAKEMLYYSKTLGIEKSNFFSLFNAWFYWDNSQKIWEKVSLIISETISDFGSNLLRVFFSLFSYLIIVYFLIYITNLLQFTLLTVFPILLDWLDIKNSKVIYFLDTLSDILVFLFFIWILYFFNSFLEETFNKLSDSKNYDRYFFFTTLFLWFLISFLTIQDFYWIKTLVFLLNPLVWFDYNFFSWLPWTEQLGLIIHKIIIATFVYHLIITLRRTTKR